jgi:hypothetical protein
MQEKKEWEWKKGTAEKNKGYSKTANAICHCPACDKD